jgi:hypothetical protein
MSRHDDRSPRTAILSLVDAIAESAAAVRPDRVRAARARIASGYYDRADVRRALAEALLVELVPSS